MPIYEYECEGCKKVYEFIHKHDETIGNVVCDDCHKKIHKIVSASGFILLGSGWTPKYGKPYRESEWD